MVPEAACPSCRGKGRMSTSARQETILNANASRRAAVNNFDQSCRNELNIQSDSWLGSMRISKDSNTQQDFNSTDNAIDANLGTSTGGGHSSGTERPHRKLRCTKLVAHMLEALRNKDSFSSTDCTSSTDAGQSASVLRARTRTSAIDTQVETRPTREDRFSNAHLIERKRDKALRFAMLVVGLSNLGIQLAQLI